MSNVVFARPAPKSFARMVGAQRNAPAPRAALKLDAAGQECSSRGRDEWAGSIRRQRLARSGRVIPA